MNDHSNGSASAVLQIGKSRSRYKHQDQLLLGFMHKPGCTAKEIATEYYDWQYEKYADAPKRASDLASNKLQYLKQLNNRVCRRSGKEAHTYEVTDRGINHLRLIGLLSGSAVIPVAVEQVPILPNGKKIFSGLRSSLS